MTAVTSNSLTGDPYIDALFSGTKWATNSLTFSFPSSASLYGSTYGSGETTSNFKALTATQQAQIHNVLQNYSAVANISFTEVAETSSSHGDIRYAESDKPATAWGYYPSSSAIGGDVWFNNSGHYYDNPVKGNYAYSIFMHETGHALGLKHPQDVSGQFGAMPADHDSVEYTVMSYHSYVGSSISAYTVASNSYPQSLMMYDIAALQTMYGANYTTESGDTTYRWDPATGREYINGVAQLAPVANKIFLTVWDGGGNDTYDFSNYTTNLKVDLDPGAWTTTSTTQLANLGNGHYAAGNIANALMFQGNPASLIENAAGGSGGDSIVGNQADNHLTGNAGNDMLDGGAGTDTAVYHDLEADYSWTQNSDGSWLIRDLKVGGLDGTDTLFNIEQLQFADGTVTIGAAAPVVSTVPVTNSNSNSAPVISSAAPAVTLTEWKDGSTQESSNTAHTAQGTIIFSDPDSADVHTVSVTPSGSGYLGSFSVGAVNETADSFAWSFSVSDSALDYLKAGQTLSQDYAVTVDDGHGGAATQTVNVVLAGADDATTSTTTTTTTTTTPTTKVTKFGLHKKGGGNAAGNDTLHHDNAPAGSADGLDIYINQQGHVELTPHGPSLVAAMVRFLAEARLHVGDTHFDFNGTDVTGTTDVTDTSDVFDTTDLLDLGGALGSSDWLV